MTKRITIVLLLSAFITVEASAQRRHTHRRRGALLGGLAGAALGAVIGDKGNNETAGALIGGAVGAVAGGTMGDQKDQQIQHNRRYHSNHIQHSQPYNAAQYGPNNQHSQQYYRPQTYPVPAPALAPVLASAPVPVVGPTIAGQRAALPQDVLNMVRSGWRESMIIQQVQLRGMQRQLTVAEVLQLHKLGVSQPILVAMQEAAPIVVAEELVTEKVGTEQLPLPAPPAPYGQSIMAPSNGSK